MQMTASARSQLNTTVRSLRERLIHELTAFAEATYQLRLPPAEAQLTEVNRHRRARLEAWLDHQLHTEPARIQSDARLRTRARAQHLNKAIAQAAATPLNRLVVIKRLEATGAIKPALLTGGRSSLTGEFTDCAPTQPVQPLTDDSPEGDSLLLRLVCEELAQELPGLFGDVGLIDLFPLPAATLRAVIEALDHDALTSAWEDDTTLGWVYQYWNDPDREALDQKLNSGGKVEPHEIGPKTQMFTERYMVQWLLHNSLGQTWLAICDKNGWIPHCTQHGTLDALEQRRDQWRAKRQAGEVELDALMPLENEQERRWAYWVPQPLTAEAVAHAPDSIRALKLLDPACGCGHFLVQAFDLLVALYREEAQHRGLEWSDAQIACWVIEDNLHGIDIDPRAVQIAAAALWLKVRALADDARPSRFNLVASTLRLGSLPEDAPALQELCDQVHRECAIPPDLTRGVVKALADADHLGTLFKVKATLLDAIDQHGVNRLALGETLGDETHQRLNDRSVHVLLSKLEAFLARVSAADDLGLRLRDGRQAAPGVRFLKMIQPDQYDLVVGNPPYQSTSRMRDTAYIKKHYKEGKADLFAAFLVRGLELARPGGLSAMVTMRNWMFIKQFKPLREHLLSYKLNVLGDLDTGAFKEIGGAVVSVAMPVFSKLQSQNKASIAIRPADAERSSTKRTARKRAALLAQVGRFEFDVTALRGVDGWPVVYWWDTPFLEHYLGSPKLSDVASVRQGMATSNNTRFLRKPWEVARQKIHISNTFSQEPPRIDWVPYIKGAAGRVWMEPLSYVVRYRTRYLAIHVAERNGKRASRPQNTDYYFEQGVAVSAIGSNVSGRKHRFSGLFDAMGQSIFASRFLSVNEATCLLNQRNTQKILASLNPSIHFQVGDINRLPASFVQSADAIFARIEEAFGEHESHREPSVEYKRPGPSAWEYAQGWAQRAVDRPEGAPLPPYEPTYIQAPPSDHVSYALGLALGRFDASGSGLLDLSSGDTPTQPITPHGYLYLSSYTTADGLATPAAGPLHTAWQTHGPHIDTKRDLRSYLREVFFEGVHRPMYENAPIYFPLSSANANFVAWTSIHRWQDDTLQTLLAEALLPELAHIQGELDDLRAAAHPSGKATARAAQERLDEVSKLRDELERFIDAVTMCAERGPDAAPKTTEPKTDAPYRMHLDDGVMINASALWPLLDPQWKKHPSKHWQELCHAKGRKDYDWSRLAARYFPDRVDLKCKKDPSLAVAHGCFWTHHPARAYAWELRLQDEIGPGFTLDEKGSDVSRQRFLEEHPDEARQIEAAEHKRRERSRKKARKQQFV